jgi:hypothetical protein
MLLNNNFYTEDGTEHGNKQALVSNKGNEDILGMLKLTQG